jgi:Flp pilus assembly protein TadB
MSTIDDERIQKLEQTLTEAHRTRSTPSWQAEWVEGVMHEIHRVARQQPPVRTNGDVRHLVWQAASFATALAVLLMVSLLMGSPNVVSGEGDLMAEDVEMGSLFFE